MPLQFPLAAAATSALGVALGVRLLLLLARSRALKPLSAATSAAAAALKTPRVLASSSSPLAALLAASKAASKSYKAARALRPAARLPSLPSSKHLKAAFAAASLLRLAAAAPPPAASPTVFAALAILKSGYELSKNSAKVIEGFLGLQVHKGFRNGVDALGVVVKVAVIASEVAVWVGGRCWGVRRGRCVRFLGFTRPSSLVLVGCGKSEARVALLDPGTVEMDDEGCRLEEREASLLLCLAVPVPVETTLSNSFFANLPRTRGLLSAKVFLQAYCILLCVSTIELVESSKPEISVGGNVGGLPLHPFIRFGMLPAYLQCC